jgi:hypothetical protein
VTVTSVDKIDIENQRRPSMRDTFKHVRLAALAGAIFTSSMALPHRADAMTFSTPVGALAAAATADGAQAEQVRWCGWRGCWGGYYYRPRVYGYYGYYRPYWGVRRWWW